MPIDPDFMKMPKAGSHNDHDVRGNVDPPKSLGVHGTQVAVDHDVCNGDAICVSVCPVTVFDMIDSPGNPVSEQKSDPVREQDCIFCRACEVNCPTQAIKITEP
ncbi:MAG: 4Fe-4S binding protein [Candidatus Bathyarchaeota archaeon]|nr:MAG: 4Fe-4S binding protein [Candidatus Bathyarchaeota archaeon]